MSVFSYWKDVEICLKRDNIYNIIKAIEILPKLIVSMINTNFINNDINVFKYIFYHNILVCLRKWVQV